MIDHDDILPLTLTVVDNGLEKLARGGDSETTLNYLYCLRDEINARIETESKERK